MTSDTDAPQTRRPPPSAPRARRHSDRSSSRKQRRVLRLADLPTLRSIPNKFTPAPLRPTDWLKDRFRRTAAARRQAKTFLERPVFGIKRPFSNAWGIRDPRGGQISIQRRRRDAEAMCGLSHAFEPVRELPAEIGCVALIGAGQRDLEGRVWSPIPPVPSIGSPAVFHSGNPSSSRRAR